MRGTRRVNLVPRPGSLCTSTSPPWARTMFRVVASPSPVPPGLVVWNGRKILGRSAGSIPLPVSITSRQTVSPSDRVCRTISPPSGIACSALSIRLRSAWRNRSRSRHAGGGVKADVDVGGLGRRAEKVNQFGGQVVQTGRLRLQGLAADEPEEVV